MHLANLDNEVWFKRVFTDREVFTAFVKDVTGVDVVVGKIETEKKLDRKVAAIDFKLDIFAESTDHRILIEIQRVDYDRNFDRFMHYFLAVLLDLQRSSAEYKFAKEVYAIIVITAPYVVKEKTGEPVKDDVLVNDLNPRTLQGIERCIWGHKLIFLNPFHARPDTPPEIADWLTLIRESMKNPQNPKINLKKRAIRKAAKLANYDFLTPEQLAEAKNAEARKATKAVYEEKAREQGAMEEKTSRIRKALERGKLTVEEIAEDFEVGAEFVLEIQQALQDEKSKH